LCRGSGRKVRARIEGIPVIETTEVGIEIRGVDRREAKVIGNDHDLRRFLDRDRETGIGIDGVGEEVDREVIRGNGTANGSARGGHTRAVGRVIVIEGTETDEDHVHRQKTIGQIDVTGNHPSLKVRRGSGTRGSLQGPLHRTTRNGGRAALAVINLICAAV
jgi:hypothetical protein